MNRLRLITCLLLLVSSRAADYGGSQFVGFSDFSKFAHEGSTLTSPIISPDIQWDELIVSWNLRGAGQAVIETRVVFPDATTPYYQLGVWSADERHSVTNQVDEFATVALDTLFMKRPAGKTQASITLTGAAPGDLKYLAFNFADTKTIGTRGNSSLPNRQAWRKTLKVPIRSQLDFRAGKSWCSPTGYSMILEFWARELNRPELNLSVPEMARRAFDPAWPSAGNWVFNTAVGGHFPGMRSYVTRLAGISELEDWIQAGIPVAASVSYNRLKGEDKSGNGHLVVCVGFDRFGAIIVNDPGAQRDHSRRTFSRERFRAAWADSHNTVYLTYPEGAKIPEAKSSHWE